MRIVIHSRSFAPSLGGLERFGEDLAQWLAGAGHEVTVVTATPAGAAVDKGRGYRVVRTDAPRRVVPLLRHAQVVHVSGLSLRGIGLARLAGRPVVVTHHGYQAVCPTGLMLPTRGSCEARGSTPGPCDGCPGRRRWGRANVRAHRVGAHSCDFNVGVSRYLTRRIGVPRSLTIHNGLTPETSAHVAEGPGDDGRIAFAGRLVEEKGLDLLIRAMPSLPDARLQVAGDGPVRTAMERLATDLGVAHRVRFAGRLSPEGVRGLYARSAVVCVPSRWHEPFGYAVSEAMALGRPIVATPMGAFTELLEGERGRLAAAVSPDALAEALRDVLRSPPGHRAGMGAAARRFALAELSMDAIGRRYETVYEEALSRHGNTPPGTVAGPPPQSAEPPPVGGNARRAAPPS